MRVVINTPEGPYIVPVVDSQIVVSLTKIGTLSAGGFLLIPYPISGTEGPEWKLTIVPSESVGVVVENDGFGGIQI